MKKSEMIEKVSAVKAISLNDEQLLLGWFEGFMRSEAFGEAGPEDEIDFGPFVARFPLWQLQDEEVIDHALTTLLLQGVVQSTPQKTTFMATEISDIAAENLAYLDKYYFDITEILAFMQSQQAQGRNIWQNPQIEQRTNFTAVAQALLRDHPITSSFIAEHEQQQRQRAEQVRREVPDVFYALLERHLKNLNEIGKHSVPWSFPSTVFAECEVEKGRFLAELKAAVTAEQLALIWEMPINVPLRRGPTFSVTYKDVFYGTNEIDCIKVQQAVQWYLLQNKRPSTCVPDEVLRSREGGNVNFPGQEQE